MNQSTTSTRADLPASLRPRPPIAPAEPWHYPTPSERTLPNGLRVWRFDLPGQHVATASLVLDLPLSAEPRELEGVATMVLNCGDEGTVQHPGEELIDALEACGAAYEGSATSSATIVTLDVPTTRLAPALGLFAEIVQSPAYADADVQRHLALRLAEIEQVHASPAALAGLAVRQVLFDAESREHRPHAGTRASVQVITPDAVRAFHQRWWRPEGAVLVLAGELDDDVDALVDACFGGWQPALPGDGQSSQHQVPTPSLAAARHDGARVVHLVDHPAAVQGELRISGIGVDRTSRSFAPLQVAGSAMGGSFGSRLNTVLREEKGYTYGAHFSVAPARLGGTWAMSASVRTEACVDALTEALRILALDEPFTDEEVADAVNQQLGIAPLRYDTAGAIAGQAAALAAAGWDAGFVNLHFTRVAQVSAATATDAYRRIVSDEAMHVVLVGDAATLAPALEAAGYRVEPLEVTA